MHSNLGNYTTLLDWIHASKGWKLCGEDNSILRLCCSVFYHRLLLYGPTIFKSHNLIRKKGSEKVIIWDGGDHNKNILKMDFIGSLSAFECVQRLAAKWRKLCFARTRRPFELSPFLFLNFFSFYSFFIDLICAWHLPFVTSFCLCDDDEALCTLESA